MLSLLTLLFFQCTDQSLRSTDLGTETEPKDVDLLESQKTKEEVAGINLYMLREVAMEAGWQLYYLLKENKNKKEALNPSPPPSLALMMMILYMFVVIWTMWE